MPIACWILSLTTIINSCRRLIIKITKALVIVVNFSLRDSLHAYIVCEAHAGTSFVHFNVHMPTASKLA